MLDEKKSSIEVQKEIYSVIPSEEKYKNFSFRRNWYATLVVFLILAIKICNEWIKKSLSYSFGFSVPEGFPVD